MILFPLHTGVTVPSRHLLICLLSRFWTSLSADEVTLVIVGQGIPRSAPNIGSRCAEPVMEHHE